MSWWKYDSAFAVKWREPQRFKWLRRKAELREPGTTLFFVKMVALCFCLFTFPFFIDRLFNRLHPGREPRSLALVAAVAAALSILVAAVSLLAVIGEGRLFPRTLVLARNWMGVLWEAHPRWLYPEIEKVRFGTMCLGQEEFRVMIVTSHGGEEFPLALSSKVDLQQIIEVLQGKGVSFAS
jgi:hypothetical protein